MEPAIEGVRAAPAEHYDNAHEMLQRSHIDAPVASIARMNNLLEVLGETMLGLLRVEMARLEAGR